MDINDILHGKWTIPVSVGITTFAAGVGAGYILGKRNPIVETVYVNVVEKESQIFSESVSDSSFVDIEDQIDAANVDIETQIDQIEENHNQYVEDIAQEEVETEVETEVEIISTNVFAGTTTEWNYDEELSQRGPQDPYVIHADEFQANELEFQQETLTYYAGDDIMAGQDDVPIYGYSELMGQLMFGHGSNDANVVYIRNPKLHIEWEVLRDSGSFETEVLGLTVEKDYAEADMKHSNQRKFRPD